METNERERGRGARTGRNAPRLQAIPGALVIPAKAGTYRMRPLMRRGNLPRRAEWTRKRRERAMATRCEPARANSPLRRRAPAPYDERGRTPSAGQTRDRRSNR